MQSLPSKYLYSSLVFLVDNSNKNYPHWHVPFNCNDFIMAHESRYLKCQFSSQLVSQRHQLEHSDSCGHVEYNKIPRNECTWESRLCWTDLFFITTHLSCYRAYIWPPTSLSCSNTFTTFPMKFKPVAWKHFSMVSSLFLSPQHISPCYSSPWSPMSFSQWPLA